MDIDTKTYPEDRRSASTSKRQALIKYPFVDSRDLSPELEYFSYGNGHYVLRDDYKQSVRLDQRGVRTTTEIHWRRTRP